MYSDKRSPYQCVEISLFPQRESYKSQKIDYAIVKLSTSGVITGPAQKRNLEILLNTNGLTKAEEKIKKKLRHEGIVVPANLRDLITKKQEPEVKPNTPNYPIG